MGYYGTAHAGRDPAQRAGEPRLVHRLHALSGRGQPGPARGAADLPADGRRSHRARARQRVPARRGDRRRRGDGDGAGGSARAAPTPSSSTPTATRRRSPCCAPGPRASASRSRSAIRRPSSTGREVFGALLHYPGSSGAVRDLRPVIERLHERSGARDRRDCDLLSLVAADAARRAGRRHRDRQRAALRRADGLRRPACGVLRHPRRRTSGRCPAG